MTLPLPVNARPSINRLYRFQWEPVQDAFVLLYPEGMVKLNQSAGEILRRCDGQRSIGELVSDLERAFNVSALQAEVADFLSFAHEQGWVAWDLAAEPAP